MVTNMVELHTVNIIWQQICKVTDFSGLRTPPSTTTHTHTYNKQSSMHFELQVDFEKCFKTKLILNHSDSENI